jgi:hypothetical protein
MTHGYFPKVVTTHELVNKALGDCMTKSGNSIYAMHNCR